MLPLPISFRDRGFFYEQLDRQGDVALYSQTNHAGIRRYEVVRIRIQREHTWPNGTTTPEKEAYPGSNAWGTLGWTFLERPLAEAKLRVLQGQPDAQPDGPEPALATPRDHARALGTLGACSSASAQGAQDRRALSLAIVRGIATAWPFGALAPAP